MYAAFYGSFAWLPLFKVVLIALFFDVTHYDSTEHLLIFHTDATLLLGIWDDECVYQMAIKRWAACT